eukprot:GHVP01056811.1.p1 GENE.GHVP01056811.1~~GHVP01056811.1.p1  ORF type:complete len:211 (+),score=29.33 GHVP01056811.1:563-1195(+)
MNNRAKTKHELLFHVLPNLARRKRILYAGKDPEEIDKKFSHFLDVYEKSSDLRVVDSIIYKNVFPAECPFMDCKRMCPSYRMLVEHVRLHAIKSSEGSKYFSCECSAKFVDRLSLRIHRESDHPMPFKCFECKCIIESAEMWKKHRASHRNQERKIRNLLAEARLAIKEDGDSSRNIYVCSTPKCGATYLTKNRLKKHITMIHPQGTKLN